MLYLVESNLKRHRKDKIIFLVHYFSSYSSIKVKQSHYRPGQALRFQEDGAPRFQDNWHMKVVRLSVLRTGRLYPPGNIPDTHFCWRLSQPQSHNAAGRIMSMINSSDTIGNRTRNLPACSTVPQRTAPPGAPLPLIGRLNVRNVIHETLKAWFVRFF